MALGALSRPALGQSAGLGALYDARTDTFISKSGSHSSSLFKSAPPASAVDTKHHQTTDVSVAEIRNLKEKCAHLGVDVELRASIWAGFVKPGGCARYLAQHSGQHNAAHKALRYTVTTAEETLNLAAAEIKNCLAFSTLDTDIATHVVVGIRWGASYLICPRSATMEALDDAQDGVDVEADLAIQRLGHLLNAPERGSLNKAVAAFEALDSASTPELCMFGDVMPQGVPDPADSTSSTISALSRIHHLISRTNGGKGTQLHYTLMPLSLLAVFRLFNIKVDLDVHQSNPDCLEDLMQHLEDSLSARATVRRYISQCQQLPGVVPPGHLAYVGQQLYNAKIADKALKSDFMTALREVRSGRARADRVGQLLRDFRAREMSPSEIRSLAMLTSKIEFVRNIIGLGSKYVGFQTPGLDDLLNESPQGDAYVLYFNNTMRHESDIWEDTKRLFIELLKNNAKQKMVTAVDCDAICQSLERPYICRLRSRRVLIKDLLKHRKVLATDCVMQYDGRALNRSLTSKPMQRRAVRIPCPHRRCDKTLHCSWICAICHSPVEYGYVDERLYCDCGATPFTRWAFRCNDSTHGPAWVCYDNQLLQQQLRKLKPFEDLNILILGETGVGKSTWINAFVNYLTYDSLDDAIQAGGLKCLIPCSFSTEMKDPSDPQGRFVQKKIRIGNSQTEHDGARGQSATQCTSVYGLTIGSTRVRLIDTPGIGDTKGLEQDNRNMADILRVLRSYDKLHGILILLKPNDARLTVMFRFCIKQLLTQLHRNAANNIVFGFTNTRGSNYKPGDTFQPLETLLTEYKQVDMGLFGHNVYCFDSESFRYLAARQKGIDMGLLEDNRRSWEYSVSESKRLLEHIKSLTPHHVRSTINLNETRDMIVRLTEPMALIAQKIQSSIAVNNDQIRTLRNAELSRAELEKSLYVQRETVESYEVKKPRTVCTHADCVEVRNDFAGRDEVVVVYKTMCHKPCYLHNVVKRNQKGDKALRRCWAMNKKGFCRLCGHNYLDHMHIYYDYKPLTYKHENQDVSRELVKHATDIELQQEAIRLKNTAIEEFKTEYAQVQEAAIQFGFFLKRHAIEPYNDATVEYVDHLVDQEKLKISNGGNKDTLKMLEQYRAEHLQKVQALTLAMQRGDTDIILDDQGVRQLVDSLYGLPHFGEDLKRIVRVNERAAEATFREKTCNLSAGKHWICQKLAASRRMSRTRGGRLDKSSLASLDEQIIAAAAYQAAAMVNQAQIPVMEMYSLCYHPLASWGYVLFPGARVRLKNLWPFGGN